MLVSEVNLLRDFKHPHIVRYVDRIVDRDATTIYIVMEFCEGGDLAALIKQQKRDRYAVMEGIFRASNNLRFLHATRKYIDEEFIWKVFWQMLQAMDVRLRAHTHVYRHLQGLTFALALTAGLPEAQRWRCASSRLEASQHISRQTP